MGNLVWHEWGRLIALTAGVYDVAAGGFGCIWEKAFFDMLTNAFDPAVKPLPILQIVCIIFGLFVLAMEYPLPLLKGTSIHNNFIFRIVLYILIAAETILVYQATNGALYLLIAAMIYTRAHALGERGDDAQKGQATRA